MLKRFRVKESNNNPDTNLQHHSRTSQQQVRPQDIQTLTEPVLVRARNAKHGIRHSNDLLDFVGDRCVNLAAALHWLPVYSRPTG